MPLVMRETFGEVLGLRRPIGSGPRPAQIWEPEIYGPDGPTGSNGASNCSSHHPDLSHIGFDGSRTTILGVVAQNATASA